MFRTLVTRDRARRFALTGALSLFTAIIVAPATEGWKTIPSWYVVGDADLVIPPKAQLFMATRAKAHISHAVDGDHPSMLSRPAATVAAIMAAVTATSH